MKDLLLNQLKQYEDEFKHFIGIEEFPEYQLLIKEASLDIAEAQGFEVAASTSHNPIDGSHVLLVSTNLELSRYLIFHEFTHIIDSELNVNGDKRRYAGLSGFTEYHASQVELMQLLGADKCSDVLSFSMDTIITTFVGDKSVNQYVNEKYQHAIVLFSRDDFPADLNTLKSAMGVLFNYFGLRSICEAYSVDYTEKIDNQAFMKFIPSLHFCTLNNLMHGWISKERIEKCMNIYLNIIFPLIRGFKLA